ncbi:metalloregulator ArsR/SmtB family transcription factor [Kitasatospora kazusensis]|uniref:Metalloregulator ArsR/SmtB family transcription factor n=1 Tax=Kitasatospora kazusensis TaxID=407974 RepID=A0ABN2YW10_9ACTN
MSEDPQAPAVDRAPRRAIDEVALCHAVEGIGDRDRVARAATRLALLGEPGRLALLLAIRHAGSIPVSDLALAAGLSDTAASQALRLLRKAGLVVATKEGRVVRYRLGDTGLAGMLDLLVSPNA